MSDHEGIQFKRGTRPSQWGVFELVRDGGEVRVSPRRWPRVPIMVGGFLMLGMFGVIAAFVLVELVSRAGPAVWVIYAAGAVFYAGISAIVGAAMLVPNRSERARGDILRMNGRSSEIELPRIGQKIHAPEVRAVWCGWGWTRSEGSAKTSRVALAQLSLVVGPSDAEPSRLPLVTACRMGADLARIGDELARELGVPFERRQLPSTHMPTTAQVTGF